MDFTQNNACIGPLPHGNYAANTSFLTRPLPIPNIRTVEVWLKGSLMNIGLMIRSYRLQRGLSQGDIEKRTGLLRCYLSRVENGHTVPSLDTLSKIAQALDVPMA